MSELAVLVPMLHRAHRVDPLLASLNLSTTVERTVLFLCSPGDDEVITEVRRHCFEPLVVDWQPGPGDYARKINLGVRETDEPMLFLAADDLRFHPGWFEAAKAVLAPGIGVVGTNDLGSPRVLAGEHATHSLVTREYAELGLIDGRPGLLNEDYAHEYVDDELVGTAKKRGAWAFARDSVVEHLHPSWGKAEMDDLYAAQRDRMRAGVGLYRMRRALWR